MTYQKVKNELGKRNVSVNKFARDHNIDCGNLTNCLNGKRPLYPKYKKLLSDFLGIDEAVLFPDVERGADEND